MQIVMSLSWLLLSLSCQFTLKSLRDGGPAGTAGPCRRLADEAAEDIGALDGTGHIGLGAITARVPAGVRFHVRGGLFFVGPDQTQTPFGDGSLCISGTITRLDVIQPDSGVAHYAAFDLGAFGTPLNVQYWYRDPAAGGAGFNLSDALGL